MGLILLIVGIVIFVLLNLMISIYLVKKEIRAIWSAKRYLELVFTIFAYLFVVAGLLIPKYRYLSGIGFLFGLIAIIIYVIHVARHNKEEKDKS